MDNDRIRIFITHLLNSEVYNYVSSEHTESLTSHLVTVNYQAGHSSYSS